MKKVIPSTAPGSWALLISNTIRVTYGNRAVKYTTYKQETNEGRHSLYFHPSLSLYPSGFLSLFLPTLPVDFTPEKLPQG